MLSWHAAMSTSVHSHWSHHIDMILKHAQICCLDINKHNNK
jgi:hypothetical protein